jgi:hypothetical protein
MDARIIDLAAERQQRRRNEPPSAVDVNEAVGLMRLAGSAWMLGWLSFWMAMWRPVGRGSPVAHGPPVP